MGRRWLPVLALALGVPAVVVLVSALDTAADVVISEVMTSNVATILDEDGEASDWLELWNRSSASVDLAGWQLSDGGEAWRIPQVTLGPDERLVIWASGKSSQHTQHTDFRLSADGEYLSLQDAEGQMVFKYEPIPALGWDVSYGLSNDGEIGILLSPTPGLPNGPTKPSAVEKPVLSRGGGYIDGMVSLTATTATRDAELWYTTDGSTPTAGRGTRYVGSIPIDSTTTLRMVATRKGFSDSAVASATFLVMEQVLAQSGTPTGWSEAAINGQVYEFGFDQQYIDEHRDGVSAALLAAPTLAITTDLENLIDPTIGIYSNPSQFGPAWDRPVSVELIDGDSGFAIGGGLRVKGNYSRDPLNPKHSLRLTFGPQYEGAVTYPIFGPTGVQTFSSIELRTDQNNGWQLGVNRSRGGVRNTLIRDQFVRESQAAMGDPITRNRWVHLFLNGQYWGLYMLRDDLTSKHAAQRWGGSPADYDVIQHADDFGYDVEDGDDDEWLQLWDLIEDGVVSDEEYEMVDQSTDLASLAGFILINICVGNHDATPSRPLLELRGNNWQAIGGNGEPFRFFIDDAEHTLGAPDHSLGVDRSQDFPIHDANSEWTAHNFNPGWLHQVLLTRDEYRDMFRDRATTALGSGGAMASDASLARWSELRAEINLLIDAEAARWGFAGEKEFGRPEWEAEVDWVKNVWFPRRTDIVRAQLIADGLLDPTRDS